MSVSYYWYIGPYIKVYNPLKQSTEKFHSCTNPKCENYEERISDQYCSKCGTKIGIVEVPCNTRIDFDVYYEFKDEQLAEINRYDSSGDKDNIYYISNKKNLGAGRKLDCNDCEEISFDSDIIESELRVMKKDFVKEIVRLKEIFGEENVNVLWGAISYTC